MTPFRYFIRNGRKVADGVANVFQTFGGRDLRMRYRHELRGNLKHWGIEMHSVILFFLLSGLRNFLCLSLLFYSLFVVPVSASINAAPVGLPQPVTKS